MACIARVCERSAQFRNAFGSRFARVRRREKHFWTPKIAAFSRKFDARRAPNQRKTHARSAGVHRASVGTIGAVLKRIRVACCARSAPRKTFFDAQNRSIFAQLRCAARAKPAQNACALGRRASRECWNDRRSFETHSGRVLRAFVAEKNIF